MTILSSLTPLVVVFALLGGVLLLLRRVEGSTNRRRHLRVVESAPLGANRTVALVRVGSRCFLLGVTTERITLLGETRLDELPETAEPDRAPVRRLSRFFGNRGHQPETAAKAL